MTDAKRMGMQPLQCRPEINSLFSPFEFEFIATGGRLAKVPNGNLVEDDPLIKGPSLQYGHTTLQSPLCNAIWSPL